MSTLQSESQGSTAHPGPRGGEATEVPGEQLSPSHAQTPQKYPLHPEAPRWNTEAREQLLSHSNIYCWELAAFHFKQVAFAALVT